MVTVLTEFLPGRGYSLIWAIRGRAAGQDVFFWPRCPKQGIQFKTESELVLNRVCYYEQRKVSLDCEPSLTVFQACGKLG